MLKKQFISLGLFATLICMHANALLAQWIPTNGPGGLPVTALSIHDGKVFAGVSTTVYKDLFVSENNGKTWAPVTTVSYYDAVYTLFSHKSFLFAVPNCGLNRSSDDGKTWTSLGDTAMVGGIMCVAINGDTLYAGTVLDDSYVLPPTGSVYRSTDDGTSWTEIKQGLPNTPVYKIFAAQSALLAVTESGMFRSVDGGASWARAGVGLPPVQTFWSIGANLLAATYGKGVYRSLDAGATWQASNTGLRADTSNKFVTNGFVNLGSTIYLLGTGLYSSQDGGVTWSNVDSNFKENVLSFSASNSQFIAGCSRGMFLSNDNGASWSKSVTGLPIGGGGGMAVISSDLYVGEVGMNRTSDNGANWVPADSDSRNGKLGVIFTNGHQMFVSDGKIVMSPIPGKSLTIVDTMFPGRDDRPTYGSGGVNGILTFGDTILVAAAYGVYRSIDTGATWIGMNNGLPVYGMGPLVQHGSDLLLSVGYSGIYRSSDRGNSWQPSNTGIDTNRDSYFDHIAIGQNNLFIAKGYSVDNSDTNEVYISRDNARTWSILKVNIQGFTDFGTGIFSIGNGNIFVNSNLGLLYSSDDGDSWVIVNGLPDYGLPHTDVTSLAVVGQNLFAGTNSWGVWYRPLSDFGITSAVTQTSASTSQIQSYPNPFTQSTMITFSSQDEGYADVTVVNLLGTRVARIFSGELSSGEHSFSWDANGMLPGMYECVVRMNGQAQRVPMILSEP